MLKKYTLIIIMFLCSSVAFALEFTDLGKIIHTQGHVAAYCRTVQHKENVSGVVRNFRIANVPDDDDVGAVVLAALLANRDVIIAYNSVGSGCGAEPRIEYVTIF